MTDSPTAVIAMPAYNEARSIEGFLTEVLKEFRSVGVHVVVVDDCSSDNTAQAVLELAAKGEPITLERNTANMGHGPSTLLALRRALALGPKFVLATDGDGNVRASGLRVLLDAAQRKQIPTVVEGTRAGRNDAWFRRLVTIATRLLVLIHSGRVPRDANTPFRVYPSQVLNRVLSAIPDGHLTPNLLISTILRKERFSLEEIKVPVHTRVGSTEHGTTWNQRTKFLPSARFLRFCWTAARQWMISPSR